jgi:hypothetical protein
MSEPNFRLNISDDDTSTYIVNKIIMEWIHQYHSDIVSQVTEFVEEEITNYSNDQEAHTRKTKKLQEYVKK